MRKALLALSAICAASFATPGAARDLAYCIKGCDFGGGAGDCSFSSLAQCQASASGRDATCAANPYFKATTSNTTAALQTDRNRSSKRRF